jgi:hypothetical protein
MKYKRVPNPERRVGGVSEVYNLYNGAGEFLGELWHHPPVDVGPMPAESAGPNAWFCYFYKVTRNPDLWYGVPPEHCQDSVFAPQCADGHRWIDAADALAEGRTEWHKFDAYMKRMNNDRS